MEEDKGRPPPETVVAGGDNRRTYSRSVSWAAGRSPTPSNPSNSKSLWNSKARACLPPLSVSRPKTEQWPRAGSDDLGIWPAAGAAPTATTPGARLKPPSLPLKLDNNFENPPREFEFKRDKLAFFDKECSKIIDHVFLGSDAVAKNREVLRENGITHVLNCVGFVCPEYFKNDLVYKTLWLQDSPSEDITSILYDVFDYFEDVRERKGRVLVHCCQGVSRSTSLVIAYLMWKKGQSFEDAFQHVKAARGVTNPNMGFACQLLQCQKRVHAVPVSPNSVLRMYRMAPHSSYAPLHLVPKMLTYPESKALDSRGAFIVHVPSAIYVWIGKNCVPLMSESASLAASQVIRYEKANGPPLTIREGEEPSEFWGAFGYSKEQEIEDRNIEIGQRKVVDFDLDFSIFDKAADGGVVPPLAISGNGSEMCLPARQSGWERLRRKFSSGVMKELITIASSMSSNQPQNNNFKEAKCPPFDPFSYTSPSLSPSTSEYSSSFTFSPTSSNWSDLSYASAHPSPSGLEPSNPNPNPNSEAILPKISPSSGQIPKKLVKSWSFSLDDQCMEDAEEENSDVESMCDTCEGFTEVANFVLYEWPTMEKVKMDSLGIPDSKSVYIMYFANLKLATKNPHVLYIWVGRNFSCLSEEDGHAQWQAVGRDFLVQKGLATSSLVQIVKEGEEPEQLWKHLNCFSFQNTLEKVHN